MRAGMCVITAALLVLVWLPAATAAGAHGGGVGGSVGHGSSHGSSTGHAAPAVKWCSKSLEDIQKSAGDPFAIYFCSEETAKYAGEGARVVTECRKANAQCKATIWESASVLKDLTDAGIGNCLKVAATKDNQEMFKKYGAGLNTLVLCAPNGDKLVTLAGDQCSEASVSKELKSLPEKLEAWKRSQKKAGK